MDEDFFTEEQLAELGIRRDGNAREIETEGLQLKLVNIVNEMPEDQGMIIKQGLNGLRFDQGFVSKSHTQYLPKQRDSALTSRQTMETKDTINRTGDDTVEGIYDNNFDN